jgi:hypothetical protein
VRALACCLTRRPARATLSTRQRLEDPAAAVGLSPEETEARDEAREKFRILRTVLEQGGQFSGINR